jgi:hypothetical protein
MFWYAAIATALGFGGFYALERKKLPKLALPSFGGGSTFKRFQFSPVGARGSTLSDAPTSAGPWRVETRTASENGVPEIGKRYFVSVSNPNGVYVRAEGVWQGPESNLKPGKLKIDRVVEVSAPYGNKVQPSLPMEIAVPPSKLALFNDYMQRTVWESIHPTSVGETAYEGKKPKPGTKVVYAMRERAPGVAVAVLSGKALAEDSKYWPEDEGTPDKDRVLVGVENLDRAVRGGGEIPLPSAFVVPVEHLIVEGVES